VTVGIVGLGLVGGSLALDLVGQGRAVVGTDIDVDTRGAAGEAGIPVVDSIRAVADAADLVVVAVPPGEVASVLSSVTTAMPDVVVTDVTSVKDPAALGVPDPPPGWVGGHPMAGTERAGFAAARRGMLAGATWLLTPNETTHPDALVAVAELVLSVQAVPVIIDAAEHDRLVAAVSHVTHLLSFGLHGVASGMGRQLVDLVAGPSFRDATRVAASDPRFWADVVRRNQAAVQGVLDDVRAWLEQAMRADVTDLEELLTAARRHPVESASDERSVDLVDLPAQLGELRSLGMAGFAVAAVQRTDTGARLTLRCR